MKRDIIVLGSGGHASVVVDILQHSPFKIVGFTDNGKPTGTKGPMGFPILGGDEVLTKFKVEEMLLANGVGTVAPKSSREDLFTQMSHLGFEFVSVMHPSAIIASNVVLGRGVQVMAGAVIQTGATLGDNVLVNTGAMVDHDCVIGNNVHIAPGAVLAGNVTVGGGTQIGLGARIIQGITIGAYSLIGAGITVLDDIPENLRLHPAKTPVWSHRGLVDENS